MLELIRKNLALLTLVAALVGAACASLVRGKVIINPHCLTEEEMVRELDFGTSMPIVAFSHQLTKRFSGGKSYRWEANLKLDMAGGTRLLIPDEYAATAFDCESAQPDIVRLLKDYGGVWFRGVAVHTGRLMQHGDEPAPGTLAFEGEVYRCHADKIGLEASGIRIEMPLEQIRPEMIAVRHSYAWVTYPGAVGKLFVTFLLMVFVPTLTLSIAKAIVDSAASSSGTVHLFRHSLQYFGMTTVVAAGIGCLGGYLCYSLQSPGTDLRQAAAVAVGDKPIKSEYDPHPILTQLVNVVPANPLGALSNPDGNKGLQIAFTAVIIGLLLAVTGTAQRARISQSLKRILALVVKDTDLNWKALSDWADALTPVGVFFICMTFGATISRELVKQMAVVILSILGGLLLHACLLMAWIVLRRDWGDWFRKGFVPGMPGLLTALATSSSYAALPGLASVDLLAKDSSRRGIFDICTTINKNGTTIYIATVATYVLFDQLHGGASSMVFVVLLLSGLASLATAGLPFAAVFGLRMVLMATGSAGALAWAIIPLDPLVDRFVTVLNVFSNLAACSRPKAKLPAILTIPAISEAGEAGEMGV